MADEVVEKVQDEEVAPVEAMPAPDLEGDMRNEGDEQAE